jgi:hypothetical protein
MARFATAETFPTVSVERDLILHSDPDPFTRAYRRVERIPPDGELVSHTLPFRAPVASFFAGTSDQVRAEP